MGLVGTRLWPETPGVYVDEIFITSKSAAAVKDTIAAIKDKYLQLKIHEGATHNYLGMVLTFTTTGAVHISQQLISIWRSPDRVIFK